MEKETFALRAELIKEIGLMAYKFLITLNSGAFIVLLTFIANVPENSRFSIALQSVTCALTMFLISIALTFFSMTVANISAQKKLLNRQLPLGRSVTGHILWLTIPVILAFTAFVSGVMSAIDGIS